MTISIDRSVCCDLNETIAREWLVTNGLGGYAAGTVAGVLTRKQHGLLVAKSPRTEIPQLMLAKIDEEVFLDQRTYDLGTNEYQDGTFNPAGFVHLEAFHLQDGFPIFTYRLGGVQGLLLEKRIWMTQGQNTTFVQYRVKRANAGEQPGYHRNGAHKTSGSQDLHAANAPDQQALMLTLLPLAAYRPYNQHQYGNLETAYTVYPHHTEQHGGETKREPLPTLPLARGMAGCTIQAFPETSPYHIMALGHPDSEINFLPTGVWYWHFLHRHDSTPQAPFTDDLYLPGVFRAKLWPGEDATLTLMISCEELTQLPLNRERLAEIYRESCASQRELVEVGPESTNFFADGISRTPAQPLRVLPLTNAINPYTGGKNYLTHLLQAGKQFIAHSIQENDNPTWQNYHGSHMGGMRERAYNYPPARNEPRTVIHTSYFGLENHTRDMLIALPGLLIVRGYHQEAREILQHLSQYFLGGLLPDRLPTRERPLIDSDYSNADTTLWYFYALDYYLRSTRQYEFLEGVFQHLKECLNRYIHGTHNGIRVDPDDGLLYAAREDRALTWMDGYANGQPVTPRAGKAVELNALWYHALSLMHEWSQHLSHMGSFGYSSLYYQQLLVRCEEHFHWRFWYAEGGYLYDVIDGPEGHDASLRPNQLFALSLRYPILRGQRRKQVMEVVTRHLLTRYGLRTLSPQDRAYQGQIRGKHGDEYARALHQGSTWPWLIGTYIDALLATESQPAQIQESQRLQEYLWRRGLQLLEPFQERFQLDLMGMCELVLDGNPPHQPAIESNHLVGAISIAELLRSYQSLAQMRAIEPEHAYSL